MSLGALAVRGATARQELEWIAFALREPVLEPGVRVWAYAAAAVVLGCSGRPTDAMKERADAAGADLCIRPSGGGAVLAGPWLLGTSVILPPRHPLVDASIAQSFRWFGLTHTEWLQRIGIAAHAVPAAVAPHGRALPWACFAGLSHWEVEAGGGKIVGLAQCRRRNGVLFSSAVILDPPPWELLCEVVGEPREDAAVLATRTTSCSDMMGRRASGEALGSSLVQHLAHALPQLEGALQSVQMPESGAG